MFSSREKLKGHCEDIRKALAKLDTGGSGSVSLFQLQRALRDGGVPFKEAELAALLGRFALAGVRAAFLPPPLSKQTDIAMAHTSSGPPHANGLESPGAEGKAA